MIEVFGGKAAYSNFWGGMDEEASHGSCKYYLTKLKLQLTYG